MKSSKKIKKKPKSHHHDQHRIIQGMQRWFKNNLFLQHITQKSENMKQTSHDYLPRQMHSVQQTSTEYVPGIIQGSRTKAHIFPPLTRLTSSGKKKKHLKSLN